MRMHEYLMKGAQSLSLSQITEAGGSASHDESPLGLKPYLHIDGESTWSRQPLPFALQVFVHM